MGLHIAEIEFKGGVPSFHAISLQYKSQTGLNMELMASIHLATDEFAGILQDSSTLLSILQTDAVTVAAIDARYKGLISPLISTGHYERAAKIRDQKDEEKKLLNYISNIKVVVDYGNFYPIQISTHGQIITVDMEYNQYYAVASLIKSLVDLGGVYRSGDKEQTLPSSWQKLKLWQDYKWYNRPRK